MKQRRLILLVLGIISTIFGCATVTGITTFVINVLPQDSLAPSKLVGTWYQAYNANMIYTFNSDGTYQVQGTNAFRFNNSSKYLWLDSQHLEIDGIKYLITIVGSNVLLFDGRNTIELRPIAEPTYTPYTTQLPLPASTQTSRLPIYKIPSLKDQNR